MPEAEDRADADRRRYEIEELIATGRALSSEGGTRRLVSLTLRKCREVTGADASSVYVLEGRGRRPRRRRNSCPRRTSRCRSTSRSSRSAPSRRACRDKRAVPIDRALAIIESEVKAGQVDGLLFETFVTSETYQVVL